MHIDFYPEVGGKDVLKSSLTSFLQMGRGGGGEGLLCSHCHLSHFLPFTDMLARRRLVYFDESSSVPTIQPGAFPLWK